MSYDTVAKSFVGTPATEMRCWCGVSFAIPESLYCHYWRQNDAQPGSYELHCPLGHSMIPSGPSKEKARADRAEREAAWWQERAQAAHQRANRAQASQRVTKGHLTRLRRRVAGGACPCCQRSFQNLARHMANQHPGFGKEGP